MNTTTTLALSEIRTDGGTQPREAINWEVVSEYSEAMKDGSVFPAVTVYFDGDAYWLADGFHRVEAAKKFGSTEIAVDVYQGTKREAVLHSVGANADHGLRRTNADKRRAVETLLRDPEWREYGIRWIARTSRVSEGMVHKMYHEALSVHGEQIEKPSARTVTRNGSTYTQDTSNIGSRSERESDGFPSSDPDEDREEDLDQSVLDAWEAPGHEDALETEDIEDEPEPPEPESDTPADIIVGMVVRYYEDLVEDEAPSTAHEVANQLLKHFRGVSADHNRRTG